MPSSYHGSPLLYVWGRSVFALRQALKRRRNKRKLSDTPLSEPLQTLENAVTARDWQSALTAAREAAVVAERISDAKTMGEMSTALTRLADYGRAASLGLAAQHLSRGKLPGEWNGEDISNSVLLIEMVENSKQSIGRVLRCAQMIAAAIPRAKHCMVLVEPRLVPIFKRSFPGAEIFADSENNDAVRAKADRFTSFQQLAAMFARSAEEMDKNFAPLVADPARVREFRERYARSSKLPLVGLSWGSKSYNKDVPDLRQWSELIRRERAQFVSLQYGKVPVDLPLITGHDPSRMIYDTSVDQLKDMDSFAAQVAALDAVISISNTGAHLAGALNMPSIFVIDDKFHTNWPVTDARVPWYPRGQVVLKNGRDWSEALVEVSERLRTILNNGNR